MQEIIFVSNNEHKIKEVREKIGSDISIASLSDIGFSGDIPETASSLEGNAEQKADYIYQRYHCDCFADDTGLEIDALDGKPGVYSARYAGDDANSMRNIQKVLNELQGEKNRKARFRTVICLIQKGEKYFFEGIAEGEIINELKGNKGFGYDPVFVPNAYEKTFAELSSETKNAISHRGKAVKKLVDFLLSKEEA